MGTDVSTLYLPYHFLNFYFRTKCVYPSTFFPKRIYGRKMCYISSVLEFQTLLSYV